MYKALITASTAAAALLAIPAAAQAQDRDGDFNGPYISIYGGGSTPGSGKGNPVEFDTNRDGDFGDPVLTTGAADAFAPGFCNGKATGNALTNCSGDKGDIEYGVRLGYDARMGDLVIGGLIEGSKPEAVDYASAYSITPAGYHFSRELDWAASARARVGYTPGGGALFYVTGGGSYAKMNHSFSTTNGANSFTPVNDDKMVWGWQAGGGGEVMLASNLSLGIEYLYSRYNDKKAYVAIGQGTADPLTNPFLINGGGTNARQDTRFELHSLRATLSLQF